MRADVQPGASLVAGFEFNLSQGPDRERALECLTATVYYEAANEPLDGRQAVAQVVLNRVRHPGYPKTVCGVVFQGSGRRTGCQFTFTCDGSLLRRPSVLGWQRAREVAEQALNGYVASGVTSALNYHADYVSPYWAPSLTKVTQIGAHVFYAPGRRGSVGDAGYLGGEPEVWTEALAARSDARSRVTGTARSAAAARARARRPAPNTPVRVFQLDDLPPPTADETGIITLSAGR